jgi:hypothetical protein
VAAAIFSMVSNLEVSSLVVLVSLCCGGLGLNLSDKEDVFVGSRMVGGAGHAAIFGRESCAEVVGVSEALGGRGERLLRRGEREPLLGDRGLIDRK